MRMRNTLSLFLFLLLLQRAMPSMGQAIAIAQIQGVVSDPSGAAVPNAHITVTQTDTNLVRSTISGSDGAYVFADLPVGSYRLEVSASAFKKYSQTGIELQVGAKVQINVPLQVGTLTQEVRVTANANLVEAQQTGISTVIDQQRMIDLPLNGRNAEQLILLAGAAVAVSSGIPSEFDLSASGGIGKTWPTLTPIAIAGGQANDTNYLLDGADNVDAFVNVSLPYPFPDALQEFSVETSAVSARFGGLPGGAVNVVTKSGSNQFHGVAFEFLRNGAVNAENYFATGPDTLKRNQFGGTLGGPILKDKLFFFGGYQGTRNRTAPPSTIFYVPTQAALNGDFSTLESAACQSSGNAITLVDPTTGLPFANNFINPSRFNSSALALLKYVPVSTDPCGKVIVGLPATGDENQFISRIDWSQSQRNSIFGRYFYDGYGNPSVWNGKDILPSQRTGLLDRSQALVLSDTYSLTPTVVNSVHVSGTRLRVLRGAPANYLGPQDLGINIFTYAQNDLNLTVDGKFKTGGPGAPLDEVINVFQIADDVDMVRGRHHLSFGAGWLYRVMNEHNISCGTGAFTFNGAFTGDAMADFMLGDPNTLLQCNPDEQHPRQTIIGAYAEDVIRVTPHLTLTAGLRWDPFLAVSEKEGKGAHFNEADLLAGVKSSRYLYSPPGLLFSSDPGIPSNYTNNRLFQLAPHVGVGWDPTGKGSEVIRASYALMYNFPFLYYNQIAYDAPPWGAVITNFQPTGGLTNPWVGYPGGNPFPLPLPAYDVSFPLHSQYETLPLHIHPAYVQQWNLSYERQLGRNWLLSASYLGNLTVHKWLSLELNQAVPIPGNCVAGQYGLTAPGPCSTVANTEQRRRLTLEDPVNGPYYSYTDTPYDSGIQSYNALLLSVRHRFSQNFTLLSNYTWSHCLNIGDDQGELETSQFQDSNNPDGDYGNCSSDRRQIFNSSLVVTSPSFGQQWTQRFLGNWQFSPILSVNSGPWFTAYTNVDNSLTGNDLDRPNLVLSNPYPAQKNVNQWLNPAAFVPNALGTFGDSGRNSLLGPRSVELDVALSRFFALGSREKRLEFRFEAFNVINHPNFAVPDQFLTDSTFGQIQSAADPRILQAALKFYF